MNYFILSSDGQVEGPHSLDALKAFFTTGDISLDTQVCEEGQNTWTTVNSVLQQEQPEKPSPPPPSAWGSGVTLLYYCRDGQKVEGPLPADQVGNMAFGGELDRSVMALVAGTKNWTPLDRLPDTIYSKEAQKELQKYRKAAAYLNKSNEKLEKAKEDFKESVQKMKGDFRMLKWPIIILFAIAIAFQLLTQCHITP